MRIGMIVVLLLLVSIAQAAVPVAIIEYKNGDSWSVAPESLQVISCGSVALGSHYRGDNTDWFIDGVFFSDQPEILFRPEKDTTIVTLRVTNSDGNHEDTVTFYRKVNNNPQFKSLTYFTGTDQKKFSSGTINTAKNQDVVITREYENDDILKGNILAPPAAGMKIQDEEAGLKKVSTKVAFQNTGDYYNIEIQDKDLCGNFATNVKFGLHVYTNTNPIADIKGDNIGDESGVTLDGSESYDNDPDDRITRHEWTLEGSNKVQTGKTATFKIPVGTTANVMLCVTDSNGGKGCKTQMIAAEITINKKPIADMTGTPNEVVINTDFDLIATQSTDDSKIEKFIWDCWYKDPGTGTYIRADGFPKTTNQSTARARLGRVGEYRLELTVRDDGKPAGFPKEDTKKKNLFVLQEAPDPTPTPTPLPSADNRTADQKMLEDSIENALRNYSETDQQRVTGQMSEVESLMKSISSTSLQEDSDLTDLAVSFAVLGLYLAIFLVCVLLFMFAAGRSPKKLIQKLAEQASIWRFVGVILAIFGEAVVLTLSLISVMLAQFLIGEAPFDLGEMIAFAITSAVVSLLTPQIALNNISGFVGSVGTYSILLMIFAAVARFLGILLVIWHDFGLLIRFTKVFLFNTQYPTYIGSLIWATAAGINWLSHGGVKMGLIVPALIFLAGWGYMFILVVLFITKTGEPYIKAPVDAAKETLTIAVEAGAAVVTGGSSSIGSAAKGIVLTKAANKLNLKLKEKSEPKPKIDYSKEERI